MVTIDRAGRVVIPKDIRDRLSLGPDADVQRWRDADQR
jgi:AbrB family looped-hinge helix DNA binding protein